MDKAAYRARRIVMKAYHNEMNIFTPEAVEYGLTGGYAWELSRNSDGTLWGVTVVNNAGRKEYDLSMGFATEAEAKTHIEGLGK